MTISLNTSMQAPPPKGKGLHLDSEIRHEIRMNFVRKAENAERRAKERDKELEYDYKHSNVHCAKFEPTNPSEDDRKTTAYKYAKEGNERKMILKLGKAKGDPYVTDDGKQIQEYSKGTLTYYENDEGKPVTEFVFKDGSKAVFTELYPSTYVPERQTITENGTTTYTKINFGDQYLTNMQTQIYNANGDLIMDRQALHPNERLPL